MPKFDWIQAGNGPITLTCRGCGTPTTVRRAANVQRAANQHRCNENTKNAGR